MQKLMIASALLLGTPEVAQTMATETASPSAPTLEMQAQQCAAQAKKSFEESGWNKGLWTSDPRWSAANSQLSKYTNHYNSKLNKCFIEVTAPMQSQPGVSELWTYKFLWDAYEGKTFGGYSWHSVQGKKYWEVPPFQCLMCPNGTEASCQPCKSEEEFDSFVAKYMGDEN